MHTSRAPVLWSTVSVVAHRVRGLCAMIVNPTPARRREAVRMVAEKIEAAYQGTLAMQIEAARQAQSLWLRGWARRPTPRRLARAIGRILHAGSAPATRRLAANHRRLGRRSSR